MQTTQNQKAKRLLLTTFQLCSLICLCGTSPLVTFKTFSLTSFTVDGLNQIITPRENNWIQLPELHWDDDYFYCYGCFNVSGSLIFTDFIRKVRQNYVQRMVSQTHLSVCAFNVTPSHFTNYTLNSTIRAYRRNVGNYPCHNSTLPNSYYPAFLNGFTGINKLPFIFIKFNSTHVPKIHLYLFFGQVVNSSNILMPYLHGIQPYPKNVADELFYYEPDETTTSSPPLTSTEPTTTYVTSHSSPGVSTGVTSLVSSSLTSFTTNQATSKTTRTTQPPHTSAQVSNPCPTQQTSTTLPQLQVYTCNCSGAELCLSQGIFSFDFFFGYDESDFKCVNRTSTPAASHYLHDRKTSGSCYLDNFDLYMGGSDLLTRDNVPLCDPTVVIAIDYVTLLFVTLLFGLSVFILTAYLAHTINQRVRQLAILATPQKHNTY